MKLLVATGNVGKLNEYRDMLTGFSVEWLSLRDVGLADMDVPETGATFAENAILKAKAYSAASGLLTLADDSGLKVDALNGQPGIYSARYGAPEVTSDQGRYEKLLRALDGLPHEQRTAQFVCVIALTQPEKEAITVEGIFPGHIAEGPRGNYGFGYDPVFLLSDGRTLAELPPHEKHAISHRGRALQAARPILEQLIGQNS